MSEPDRFQEYPYTFYGGEKIKFVHEKQRYTVRCASRRYAICTKPFNAQKTVLYTIIDQWNEIRGPENLIFGWGAETDVQCLEMLVRILDGESEISSRHDAPLDIEAVYDGKQVRLPSEPLTSKIASPTSRKDK